MYLGTVGHYLFISREFKGKSALLFMQNYQLNLTNRWNSHLLLQCQKEEQNSLPACSCDRFCVTQLRSGLSHVKQYLYLWVIGFCEPADEKFTPFRIWS